MGSSLSGYSWVSGRLRHWLRQAMHSPTARSDMIDPQHFDPAPRKGALKRVLRCFVALRISKARADHRAISNIDVEITRCEGLGIKIALPVLSARRKDTFDIELATGGIVFIFQCPDIMITPWRPQIVVVDVLDQQGVRCREQGIAVGGLSLCFR